MIAPTDLWGDPMRTRAFTCAATAFVLAGTLAACSSGSANKINDRADTPDVAAMKCDDPKIPMGEWRKRCDTAAPNGGATGAGRPSVSGAASPSASASSARAGVGDTISMRGDESEKFDATLVKLVDPATPKNEFSKPESGSRLIAIQWRITNTGTTPVNSNPLFKTTVVDDQGQQFKLSLSGESGAGVAFDSDVTIPPGESRLGFVTYELPEGAKAATVQYRGGYDKPVGQWKLS
ncbi:DUF4352 domain-containing protein [Yinghuangia seranimata]|uniref:DUF4352 domain-containing protein n=1 Tax=Yinghuangia seranimata TaxID=408067 RepID=UPI00248BB2CB|nr:DUF4352 domain-containing protein [Yinghuangia seranimata]MDI2125084.1 DUF4352 domain-containing protein [Yinghuangia seranimata]